MVELVERMPDPSAGSEQVLHKQSPKAATSQNSEDLQPRTQGVKFCLQPLSASGRLKSSAH